MDGSVVKYLGERIPRYTSYPTAPHFSPSVGATLYRNWLRALPDEARLSLYLHVPFCRSLCWYCGCHTKVARHRDPIDRYAALIEREIALVSKLAGGRRVVHLHWGGGTPTIVGTGAFLALMSSLKERFTFERDAEIAVEIDPRRLDADMAAALATVGVTRASIGLQTFDPVVQRAVNRVQPLEAVQSCVARLRSAGITALNVDLLYGLPQQTVASCEATVAAALELEPARFSVFGYAHVPAMKRHQALIDAAALPGGEERLEQEGAIGEALVRAGYVRVGLDHYARPGDALARAQAQGRLRRNFQGYTDDPADALIGFGASSIGQLPQGYVQNAAGLREWAQCIEGGDLAAARGIALTREDRLRADIIERLMCDLRADIPAILHRHGFPSGFLDGERLELEALAADGLVRIDGGVIAVPEAARTLVRRIACVFDSYLRPEEGRHAVAV
ncbi:MAG TPA: oxygen-independent coproporphyrinogen III oxidase [Stellaceae bacterium]|nr:oxygen-independent coproporphyrinogen III oxidase [Stellaceae bacterium]